MRTLIIAASAVALVAAGTIAAVGQARHRPNMIRHSR